MPDRLHRYKTGGTIVAIISAAMLGFHFAEPMPEGPEAKYSTSLTTRASIHSSIAATSLETEISIPERPFWEDADVPEPDDPGPPALATLPPHTDAPVRNHEAEVLAFEKTGKLRELNDSLLLWFQHDPRAATLWINETSLFEALEPTLSTLALGMVSEGHLQTALDWVDAMPNATARRELRMRIYSHEARQKRMDAQELQQAGFNSEEVQTILGSALGD